MDTSPLLYRVTLADLPGHRLQIDLHIPKPNSLGQVLSLPAWIPGSYLIRDFSRQIESIAAFCEGEPIPINKLDKHRWQCAPCQSDLHIRYIVYAWDLSVRGAHIDESHAFFNGTSVFLLPEGQDKRQCYLELVSNGQLPDWNVYTSLPEARKSHAGIKPAKRHGFGLYEARNYDELLDHPIEIGTPQVLSFQAHGVEHELVFTGHIPNLDMSRIASDVKKICETQIAFFEPESKKAPFLDSSNRYVFLTMVTDDGYGGLEHRASTALMAARRDLPVHGQDLSSKSAGYQTFLGLVSHEYFHTWHVKRIKPASFAPYDLSRENYTRLLWVFEGFTSYYDDLMLLRAGCIDEANYFDLLSKNISAVHRSPGRFKQSIADSSFDTWTRFYKQDENSPNALVSYYSKGALAALGLDLCIRAYSQQQKSLDDVMLSLWRNYGRDFYSRAQAIGVPEDAMQAIILESTGYDASEFLEKYVYGCEDIPLQAWFADQGVELSWSSSDAHASLNVRIRPSSHQSELATVFEHGAAHAAGLSAGDILVAIDGLRVTDNTSLSRLLSAYQAGQTVLVHVFRRDELRSYSVQLAATERDKCFLKRHT